MRISSLRVAVGLIIGLLALTSISCSGPTTATVGSSEFYWSAAMETYTAGNYVKATDHLDHLIDSQNAYTSRALPWSLILTSGMAAGYMDLANAYASGARINKSNAAVFRRKAMEYRNMASPLALRFAQNIDKLATLPPGAVRLAFTLPKGSPGYSPLVARISGGVQISPADEETAQIQAIERAVLLTTCQAVGAPNDTARTSEVLGHAVALTARPTFLKAMISMLDKEADLYARDKLDDPSKVAVFHERSQNLARSMNSAMVVQAQQAAAQ